MMFNHLDPLQPYRENASRLTQKPQIQSFKFSDKEECSVSGYKIQHGEALADRWAGDVISIRRKTIKIPVYRFSCDDESFDMIWEDHGGEKVTQITVAQIPQHLQGNCFKTQRHLDSASKVLFGEQGFECAMARAAPPRLKDQGQRHKDRRRELVYIRDRFDDGTAIRITRLEKFWLQFRGVVPANFVAPEASTEKGEIAWLSPKAINEIPEGLLTAWQDALPRKRWPLEV